MNCINLSTILHRVARLAKDSHCLMITRERPQFHVISQKIEAELAAQAQRIGPTPAANSTPTGVDSLPRCWSTIGWSYATLEMRDVAVFDRIARLAENNLEKFKTFELANLLWAFGKMNISVPSFLNALANHLLTAELAEFSPRSLSMVAWAVVSSQWNMPDELLLNLVEAFVKQIDTAGPEEIANMSWTLASSKIAGGTGFRELGNAVAKQGIKLPAHEFAMTLVAFSHAGLGHSGLLTAFVDVVAKDQSIFGNFATKDLARTIVAIAKQAVLGRQQAQGLPVAVLILRACCIKLGDLKPEELSSVLWACAEMGLKQGMWMNADRVAMHIMDMTPDMLVDFKPDCMARVLYAFASFTEEEPSAGPSRADRDPPRHQQQMPDEPAFKKPRVEQQRPQDAGRGMVLVDRGNAKQLIQTGARVAAKGTDGVWTEGVVADMPTFMNAYVMITIQSDNGDQASRKFRYNQEELKARQS